MRCEPFTLHSAASPVVRTHVTDGCDQQPNMLLHTATARTPPDGCCSSIEDVPAYMYIVPSLSENPASSCRCNVKVLRKFNVETR